MQLQRVPITALFTMPLLCCVQTTRLGGQEGEDWTDTGADSGATTTDTHAPEDSEPATDTNSDSDPDSGGNASPGSDPRIFSGTIRMMVYTQGLAELCLGPIVLRSDGSLPPLDGDWSCTFHDELAALFTDGLDGVLQGQWVEGSNFGGIFVAEGDQTARWSAVWTEGAIDGQASGRVTTAEAPISYTATFHVALQ